MVAMLLIGLSNVLWMIALAVLILVYKLAPALTLRWTAVVSAGVIAVGFAYALSS